MFSQIAKLKVQTDQGKEHCYECEASTPLHEVVVVLDHMKKMVENKIEELSQKEENKDEPSEEAGV